MSTETITKFLLLTLGFWLVFVLQTAGVFNFFGVTMNVFLVLLATGAFLMSFYRNSFLFFGAFMFLIILLGFLFFRFWFLVFDFLGFCFKTGFVFFLTGFSFLPCLEVE